MNNVKLLTVILLLSTSLLADEIETLKELIERTEKNLESQLHSLEILRAYKSAKAEFINDPDNARKGSVMVRYAMELYREIETQRLTHLFPADFVYELQFFNEVGSNGNHRQEKR